MHKINNPEWIQSEHLKELLHILSPARIVGGAVRNVLMGLPITDVDIASPLLPNEIKSIAESHGFTVIPTGIEHGTVTCMKHNSKLKFEKYEVTTLRADKETDGRHAKVDFVQSWELDAIRRDFTINALFSDFDGNITDYVGGVKDLKDGFLRFIGNPENRIKEDYLRILRFFRFYAHYCNQYDINSLQACLSHLKDGLKQISRERCTYEFIRLLEAHNPWSAIALMTDELFHVAGLPGKSENEINKFIMQDSNVLTLTGYRCSHIGRIAIFNGIGELVLSKNITRRIIQIQQQKIMYSLKDYIIWINTCYNENLWDGIVIKGGNNANIIPQIMPWIEQRFPLQGRDILSLGIQPGPLVSHYLNIGLQMFAESNQPLKKEDLLNKISIESDVNNKIN